ncbi:hypothetical protein T484DRAFT_1753827 [Baffinella frigidus]|nr:hypothetical protein T484DRAFT_1753827 [Cryptophyta sp. CCMP2293]
MDICNIMVPTRNQDENLGDIFFPIRSYLNNAFNMSMQAKMAPIIQHLSFDVTNLPSASKYTGCPSVDTMKANICAHMSKDFTARLEEQRANNTSRVVQYHVNGCEDYERLFTFQSSFIGEEFVWEYITEVMMKLNLVYALRINNKHPGGTNPDDTLHEQVQETYNQCLNFLSTLDRSEMASNFAFLTSNIARTNATMRETFFECLKRLPTKVHLDGLETDEIQRMLDAMRDDFEEMKDAYRAYNKRLYDPSRSQQDIDKIQTTLSDLVQQRLCRKIFHADTSMPLRSDKSKPLRDDESIPFDVGKVLQNLDNQSLYPRALSSLVTLLCRDYSKIVNLGSFAIPEPAAHES